MRARDQALHVILRGHVHRHRFGPPPARPHRLHRLVEALDAARAEDDGAHLPRASCCAQASPIPDDAPVIAATRPARPIRA